MKININDLIITDWLFFPENFEDNLPLTYLLYRWCCDLLWPYHLSIPDNFPGCCWKFFVPDGIKYGTSMCRLNNNCFHRYGTKSFAIISSQLLITKCDNISWLSYMSSITYDTVFLLVFIFILTKNNSNNNFKNKYSSVWNVICFLDSTNV